MSEVTIDREKLMLVLEALKRCYDVDTHPADGSTIQDKAITLIEEVLAQPNHEDVFRKYLIKMIQNLESYAGENIPAIHVANFIVNTRDFLSSNPSPQIAAIKEALAQPPLPVQRQPLTDEQYEALWAAIRATGYLTKGQVDEVMEVVEIHIGAKP